MWGLRSSFSGWEGGRGGRGGYEVMLFWTRDLGSAMRWGRGKGLGGGSVYTCVRYQETMIISSLKLYSYSVSLFDADEKHIKVRKSSNTHTPILSTPTSP